MALARVAAIILQWDGYSEFLTKGRNSNWRKVTAWSVVCGGFPYFERQSRGLPRLSATTRMISTMISTMILAPERSEVARVFELTASEVTQW